MILSGWITVTKSKHLEINLDSYPLEIQTRSQGLLKTIFYNEQFKHAGTMTIDISLSAGESTYRLYDCMDEHTKFNPNIVAEGETNIWRIEKKKDASEILHIILLCNGQEVS